MSAYETIAEKVEQRVREQLLPRLLESLEMSHAKRNHRSECDCEYCKLKRRATADIGYIQPHLKNVGVRRSAIYGIGSELMWHLPVGDFANIHEMSENEYQSALKSFLEGDGILEFEDSRVFSNGVRWVTVLRTGETKRRTYVVTPERTQRIDPDEYHFKVKAVRERLAQEWRVKLREEKAR